MATRTRKSNAKSGNHNHSQCVRNALEAAERVCAKRDIKLTPIRRKVLELVWARHEPVGAYTILAKLAIDSHKPSPPTVYRALEFLIDAGLVHRIESLNSFMGCGYAEHTHRAQFMVCRACQSVEEIDDSTLERAIDTRARLSGFKLAEEPVEIRGLCGKCATT